MLLHIQGVRSLTSFSYALKIARKRDSHQSPSIECIIKAAQNYPFAVLPSCVLLEGPEGLTEQRISCIP